MFLRNETFFLPNAPLRTEKKGYATDNLLHFDLLDCSVS